LVTVTVLIPGVEKLGSFGVTGGAAVRLKIPGSVSLKPLERELKAVLDSKIGAVYEGAVALKDTVLSFKVGGTGSIEDISKSVIVGVVVKDRIGSV
tara:strand:- start:199 stop:486 length:288 start_codon:yes stop_codon:yes gene_type:complete